MRSASLACCVVFVGLSAVDSLARAVVWNGDAPDRGVTSADGLTDRVGPFANTHTTRNETNRARGTGTLLNERWVITARHCVQLGRDYGKIAPPEKIYFDVAGEKHYAAAIFVAPWSDEIALIRLAEPVKDTRPLTLNEAFDEPGKIVTFGGYGRFGWLGQTPKNAIQFHRAFNTPWVNEKTGKLMVKADGKADLKKRGLLEGIVQAGDSGGPLFVYTGGDTEKDAADWSNYRLAGIVAQGGEAKWSGDSIFARVASHAKWINETIAANPATAPTTLPATAR